VLTKETIRVGRFLGQVDIFLHSLKDEQERCGWFPLRPQRSSLHATTGKDDNVSGSIKLRLRWINTQAGFRYYVQESLEARKMQLANLHRTMKKQLAACNRRDEGQRGNRMRASATAALAGEDAVPTDGRRRRGRSDSTVVREALDEYGEDPLSPASPARDDGSVGGPELASASALMLRVPADTETMDDAVAELYRRQRQRKATLSISAAEPSPLLPSLSTTMRGLFTDTDEADGAVGFVTDSIRAGAEALAGNQSPSSRRSSRGSDSSNPLSAADVFLGPAADDADGAARSALQGEDATALTAVSMAVSDRSDRERAGGGMLASIGRRVSHLVLSMGPGTPAPFTPSLVVPQAPSSPSAGGLRASDVPAPAPMLAMLPRAPTTRTMASSTGAMNAVLRLPARKTKHPARIWAWADAAQRCAAAQAAAGPRVSAMAPRPRPQNESFVRRFEEEGNCALAHVIATSGRIEVTPIEAHNVRVLDARSQLYVQVSYGDKNYLTKKVRGPLLHVSGDSEVSLH